MLFLLLLFCFSAGYRPAVEETESLRGETLPRGLRSGLAQLWGRIGRAGKRDAGQTRWVGRMSHLLQLQYILNYSAHFSVLRSDPKLPLSLGCS